MFFFFKQKTAYEMRISDWSSDVCSSDLPGLGARHRQPAHVVGPFAADRAIEVIERAVVIDDRRLVRVFLVDRSRRADKIGRAHVCTPVTNAQLVCRLLLEKNKQENKNTPH